MSLSSSTDLLSSENEHNSEEKNMPSPNLAFVRSDQLLQSNQSSKSRGKLKNYQKKNGSLKFKIKSENESVACLRPQPMRYDSFSTENIFRLNHPLNPQKLSGELNYLKANQLEFETINYQVSPPFSAFQPFGFSQNSPYGSYFQERSLNPNEIFLSKIFSQSLKNINNFYLPQSYPNLFLIPKEIFSKKDKCPKSPKEKAIKRIKPQEKIEPSQLIKLTLDVPDDFLIHFQIQEIEVKANQLSQYIPVTPKSKKISYQDMEIYINKLCKKVMSKDISNNIFDFGEEYVEIEKPEKEENLCCFLQKKRKLSKDQGDSGSRTKLKNEAKDASYRRHPLKKKYKKINKKITVKIKNLIKLNNKKNGPSIIVNLNQVQINKIGLENFPFHHLINSKEITKISFLKGLAERKELIRINKKVGLMKEIKGNKSLEGKLFKIVYQKLMDETKYIVHISGINILYLILYYYYQIHKGIEQINTYHYSHSAFHKSLSEINKIEEIIKKCNLIVKEISKEN